MSEIKLLDVVELKEDLPAQGLRRGAVGTVVEQWGEGVFEVEFSDRQGRAYAFSALPSEQLEKLHFEQKHAAPTEPEKKQAYEGEVFELTVDLPDSGFHRGQRGAVISAFTEPTEAYDLAMESETGDFLGFAYSVKPGQFINVTMKLLDEGMNFLSKGKWVEAGKKLKGAIDLTPKVRGAILNLILESSDTIGLEKTIDLLRLLCRIAPDYDVAWENLAIALLNQAVSKAKNHELDYAQALLNQSLGVKSSADTTAKIRENLAGVFIERAEQAYISENLEESLVLLNAARATFPNETTLHNLGRAHMHLALAHMKAHKYREAIVEFEEAEMAGLVRPELINDYAIALIAVGEWETASYAFERALELDPNNQDISQNLERLRNNQPAEDFIAEQISIPYTPIPFTMPQYQMAQMAA